MLSESVLELRSPMDRLVCPVFTRICRLRVTNFISIFLFQIFLELPRAQILSVRVDLRKLLDLASQYCQRAHPFKHQAQKLN